MNDKLHAKVQNLSNIRKLKWITVFNCYLLILIGQAKVNVGQSVFSNVFQYNVIKPSLLDL